MADATSPTDLLSLLNALRSVRTVSLAPSGDQGAGAGSAIPAGLPPNVVNYPDDTEAQAIMQALGDWIGDRKALVYAYEQQQTAPALIVSTG